MVTYKKNQPKGICKCGLCFDVIYPPEYGRNIVAVCKVCKTELKEDGVLVVDAKDVPIETFHI